MDINKDDVITWDDKDYDLPTLITLEYYLLRELFLLHPLLQTLLAYQTFNIFLLHIQAVTPLKKSFKIKNKLPNNLLIF